MDAKEKEGWGVVAQVMEAQIAFDQGISNSIMFNAYSDLVDMAERVSLMIDEIDKVNDSMKVASVIDRYYPGQMGSIEHYKQMRDKFGGER